MDENSGDLISGLEQVYGSRVREGWADLKKEFPNLSDKELLEIWESDPTCNNSFFCRESNLRLLVEEVIQQNETPRILCVGCSDGPEPYELALRLQRQGQSYSIDGIDSSKKAIEEAKKYQLIQYSQYSGFPYSKEEFLYEMVKAGLLVNPRPISKTQTYAKNGEFIDHPVILDLPKSVKNRIKFARHDIIDKPYGDQAHYNIIICNNVLMHYPSWTRDLIMVNMIHSLRDNGVLVFEHNEWLGGIGMTGRRAEWLEPYYEWKKDLSRFGLQHVELNKSYVLPDSFYKYTQSENQFSGKKYGIRGQKLVQLG